MSRDKFFAGVVTRESTNASEMVSSGNGKVVAGGTFQILRQKQSKMVTMESSKSLYNDISALIGQFHSESSKLKEVSFKILSLSIERKRKARTRAGRLTRAPATTKHADNEDSHELAEEEAEHFSSETKRV